MKYLLVKAFFTASSFLILTKTITFAQSISIAPGKWESKSTWAGDLVPTVGSDVIIRHDVVIDAATGDATITDINSITITNTQNAHSSLDVTGGKSLNVKTNVTVTGTDADYNTNFNIYGTSTNVSIAGNLIVTDDNTYLRSVIISVDDKAELHVTGNFTFTKNQNFRPPSVGIDSENFVEIEMGKTLGAQPVFTVSGTTTMLYDMDDPGYFRFRLNNDSDFTTNNLLLDSDKSGYQDGGVDSTNVDLAVEMLGNSKITVNNTTTMDFSYDGVNKEHENIIEMYDNSYFLTKDLLMTSNASTSSFNNWIKINGSAIFEVENTSFVRSSYVSDNRITAYDNSQFILKGTITGANTFTWDLTNGNNTFVLAGTTPQTLPRPRNGDYQNLTINNTSTTPTDLPTNASVFGTLTLTDGILNTTSTELLTIENGGSSTTGSVASHVDGPMSKVGSTAFEFPVGDNGWWQPLSISNLSASTTLTVEYFEATPPNNTTLKSPDPNGDLLGVSGIEYWTINTSSTITTDLTLHWKDNARSEITDPATLSVAHSLGTEWENYGNDAFIDAPVGSITVTSIGVDSGNPIEYFTLGTESPLNPLPVHIVSFTGSANNQTIEIEWVTTSEENNNFFELQKSIDGSRFELIATIDGKNQGGTYLYTDFQPINGNQYYRLKQVDFDGSFEYSKVTMVTFTGHALAHPYLFPNPTSGNSINLIIPNQENLLEINLLDKAGKRIKIEYKSTSLSQFMLFVPNLQKGVYVVQIETDKRKYSEKVIRD